MQPQTKSEIRQNVKKSGTSTDRKRNTLDQMQLTSGYAEMLKHGLIYDDKHWNHLVSIKALSVNNISKYIHDSVNIKHQIVTADPFEKDSRSNWTPVSW